MYIFRCDFFKNQLHKKVFFLFLAFLSKKFFFSKVYFEFCGNNQSMSVFYKLAEHKKQNFDFFVKSAVRNLILKCKFFFFHNQSRFILFPEKRRYWRKRRKKFRTVGPAVPIDPSRANELSFLLLTLICLGFFFTINNIL